MKLCLLLCLSFVPWCYSRGSGGRRSAFSELQSPTAQPLNCGERPRSPQSREASQTPKGEKFEEFDWRLSKELNTAKKGNLVISPISLKVVLAMLYEGARGVTAQEIGNALDFNTTMAQRSLSRERFYAILQSLQTSDDGYKIKMGTHAFIDQTVNIKWRYQCKLKTYYNSDIVKVDFSNPASAVKEINNWAKKVTEGLIQDLISEAETESSTIMLLLNAVYFKGQWEIPFPLNQTKPSTFHLDHEKTVNVPFMNTVDRFNYSDLSDIGAHMVELPYKGNKFSMFVILPYNATGLDAIVRSLGPEKSLSTVISKMRLTSVNLIMPKFEFDFTTKLRSTLENLGMKNMFSTAAQLTDIANTNGGGLVVSDVLQKAGISVTEAGTVAYAATSLDLVNKFGESEETVDFEANRPFLFFIQDTTQKTTVFVGKVTDPSNAKVVSTPVETPTEKPTVVEQKPTGVTEKPTGVTEKPTGVTEKPTGDTELGSVGDRIYPENQPGYNEPLTPEDPITQARFNLFDGALLQAVSKEKRGNFVISPASIKTLLGLILEAADGHTLREIEDLLQLPKNQAQARQVMGALKAVLQKTESSNVVIDLDTNAFLSNTVRLNLTYADVISELYKAGVQDMDFRSPAIAANKINSWVNIQTRGNIPTLISAEMISPETLTILVNAVYFDAKWKKQFLQKDTKEECFYSGLGAPCSKVQMMYKKENLTYKYDKDFNYHVVQLPYQDERYSMVLVIPGTVDGATGMSHNINMLTFPNLLDNVKTKEVHLKIPKFTVEYESDIRQTLTRMGLSTAFTNDAKLPYMIIGKQGRISSVIHKAKIEVSEKGTKAAAATGASVVPLMSNNEEVFVTADHPFYFFIYEGESKSVLFSGRISSLPGGAGTEDNDNWGNDNGAIPLTGGSSLAEVSVGSAGLPSRPHSFSSTPQSRPSIPQSRPSTQKNPGDQFISNQHYNVNNKPSIPPQPHSPSQTGQDHLLPSQIGQDHHSPPKTGHDHLSFPDNDNEKSIEEIIAEKKIKQSKPKHNYNLRSTNS